MKIIFTVVYAVIVLYGIILIPNVFGEYVPTWVKNTAGWWAEDKISEVEFVNAIEFLIKHGIINVNDNSSCVNNLSEIFGDSNAVVKDTCDLHESTEYSELVPAIDKINYNSLGLRGPEFSIIKSPDTYRIFMVGGSTMIGSGATSDETTKPAILQKIFDSYNTTTQKIEVINAAFFGANSSTEFDLISQKLVRYQPDLIIIYDGWNDLRVNNTPIEVKENWETICKFG